MTAAKDKIIENSNRCVNRYGFLFPNSKLDKMRIQNAMVKAKKRNAYTKTEAFLKYWTSNIRANKPDITVIKAIILNGNKIARLFSD